MSRDPVWIPIAGLLGLLAMAALSWPPAGLMSFYYDVKSFLIGD